MVKLDWKYVLDRKLREKFDSQNLILKFNQIVVLKSLPESNPKPEVENPKPEMMDYEKPDPTRYPNAQTRPDPKPEKSLPDHALDCWPPEHPNRYAILCKVKVVYLQFTYR